MLAIDTHSDAFLAGQNLGIALIAVVALIVLWAATRKWRSPYAQNLDEVDAIAALRQKRSRAIAGCSALIVLAAGADVVLHNQNDSAYGAAASKGPTDLVVTPPAQFAGYTLITGTAADDLKARISSKLPNGTHAWFYTEGAASRTTPSLIVTAQASVWDPAVATELAAHSATYENDNFMAGARISDVATYAPGPAGGEVQCGHNTSEVLCSWCDSSTMGALVSLSDLDAAQLAVLSGQFRAAAER